MEVELLMRENFEYCPNSGIFTRKFDVVRSNGRPTHFKKGSRAGSLSGNGYRQLQLERDGVRILLHEHRAAFILMGHEIPESIDHINGVRADNRWENLRPSNDSENQCNRHVKVGKSKHLPIGIYETTRKGRPGIWYSVHCECGGRKKSTYKRNLQDAIQTRLAWEKEMFSFQSRPENPETQADS